MAHHDNTPPNPSTPQSIPLQDLSRPPDAEDGSGNAQDGRRILGRSPRFSNERRSILGRNSRGSRYERIAEGSPSRSEDIRSLRLGASSRLEPLPRTTSFDDLVSPVEDVQGFAAATSSVGLSLGGQYSPATPPQPIRNRPSIIRTTANGQDEDMEGNEGDIIFSPSDNDTTPLTQQYLQPSIAASSPSPGGQRHDRQAKRGSVHFADQESPGRASRRSGSRLGDDLPNLETGLGVHRKLSTASGISRLASVSGEDGSGIPILLSPSASPLARANSMLRMMSQRVVNLSNDSGMVEQSVRRKASVGDSRLDGPPVLPAMADYAHDGPVDQRLDSETPLEKVPSIQQLQVHEESPQYLLKRTHKSSTWKLVGNLRTRKPAPQSAVRNPGPSYYRTDHPHLDYISDGATRS